MIATVNPATGEPVTTFEPATDAEIESALVDASAAFLSWKTTPFSERAAKLRRAAEILETDTETYARLITLEMGKPIAQSRGEVRKCALACRYYADHGEAHLADEEIATGAKRSWITYQPLGIILAVMPWNFPFWQVFRYAAPTLMAGNVGILKHASNVPQCALAIEEILHRAGFDGGRFRTLLLTSSQVVGLLEDERVAAATLTGSEGAGASVAATAGRAIKKVVLELGGSDPFIVMPSAELELAASVAVRARVQNTGQSCIAAKRFIVHRDVATEFTSRFVAGMEALRVGDPMADETDVGPLSTPQILEEVDEQVTAAVAQGARILTGGHRLDRPGNYYAPTIVTDIAESSRLFREEVFGPVASLYVVDSVDEAIRIANATEFGLGSCAWTKDETEQRRFAEEIDAGQVFINAMVASDPRVPFGGVKKSGFGRELGVHGIREFVNAKTVWLA
jgi:succinate-semialdehyde dehydrogenase / glutarate-semialdehyde dehydrogenase